MKTSLSLILCASTLVACGGGPAADKSTNAAQADTTTHSAPYDTEPDALGCNKDFYVFTITDDAVTAATLHGILGVIVNSDWSLSSVQYDPTQPVQYHLAFNVPKFIACPAFGCGQGEYDQSRVRDYALSTLSGLPSVSLSCSDW